MRSKRLALAALLLLATTPLYAGFDQIETVLRARLGSPTYVPFMGVIRVVTWVIHPKGVHDIRLTVFEGKRGAIDGKEIEAVVQREIPRGFTPLVRTRSNRTGEWAFIYARPRGERLELFVVSHDREDTVLVQVDVDPDVVMREINTPHRMVASMRNSEDLVTTSTLRLRAARGRPRRRSS